MVPSEYLRVELLELTQDQDDLLNPTARDDQHASQKTTKRIAKMIFNIVAGNISWIKFWSIISCARPRHSRNLSKFKIIFNGS